MSKTQLHRLLSVNVVAAWLLLPISPSAIGQTGRINAPTSPPPGPFAGLSQELELPAETDGSPNKAPGTIELGAIAESDLTACQINLRGELADLEDLYQFSLKPNDSQPAHSWDIFIHHRADNESNNSRVIGSGRFMSEPISQLLWDSGHLSLRWNPNNITRYNPQLSNTCIELISGSVKHSIRLRKLESLDSIVLDLQKDAIRVPITLANMPRRDTVSFKVNDVELQGYDKSGLAFQPQPASAKSKLGETITLTRADAVNTEIILSLVQQKSGPELNVRATYRPAGERKLPFVAGSIKAAREKQEDALKENESRMAEAESAISGIESRLNSALALQPRDAREQIAKQSRVGQAKSELRKAQSAIRRYERSVPKLKASLAASGSVAEVGTAIHNNLRLHISIMAERDGRSLELVRFGDSKLQQGSALVVAP